MSRKLQPWRNIDDYMDWLTSRSWIGKAVLAYFGWFVAWVIAGCKWGTGEGRVESIVTAVTLAAILIPFAVLASPVIVMLWRYRPSDKGGASERNVD